MRPGADPQGSSPGLHAVETADKDSDAGDDIFSPFDGHKCVVTTMFRDRG